MNRFEILNDRLGNGNFGVAMLVKRSVWRKKVFQILWSKTVRTQVDDKMFVIKAIPHEMNSNEKDATNQEVDILKELKHPNIVR